MPDINWNRDIWSRDAVEKDGLYEFYGYQWGDPHSMACLRDVVENFITPRISQESVVLEIGPGGGRWTQFFLGCQRVYCVDINRAMFGLLKKAFPQATNIEYIHSSGTDFPGIPKASIDFMFTFGTFVHIEPLFIYEYLENLKPLLKDTGVAVVQYSDKTKEFAQKPCVST